jgi:hypothetical protein
MNDAVEHAQRVMDAVIGYLHDIGEDLAFLPLMLRAPHESITLVDDDQALMLGIHVLERNSQRLIDPGNIIKRRVASN